MNIARCVMLVAFLGISGAVALADSTGTDPKLITSGCGGKGQPACDAYLITSTHQTLNIMLTLDTTVGDVFFGDDIASFVNISGHTLTSGFGLNVNVPNGLSFQGCGAAPEGITLLFTCAGGGSPDNPITIGTAVFTLTGASICSANLDDLSFGENGVSYHSDGDNDDKCQPAFTLALQPVGGEKLPNSISASLSIPEPSSALLLLFGLAAGLLAFKGLRTNLA